VEVESKTGVVLLDDEARSLLHRFSANTTPGRNSQARSANHHVHPKAPFPVKRLHVEKSGFGTVKILLGKRPLMCHGIAKTQPDSHRTLPARTAGPCTMWGEPVKYRNYPERIRHQKSDFHSIEPKSFIGQMPSLPICAPFC
jgi:hypothetical protein